MSSAVTQFPSLSGVDTSARQTSAIPAGLWYTLSIPLCAGVVGIEGLSIAGHNYTGPLWLATFLTGLFLLSNDVLARPALLGFPRMRWGAWCGMVWISLAWCDGWNGRHIQDAMQLSMPVLVGMAAARYVRSPLHLEWLLRLFWAALAMLVAVSCLEKSGVLQAFGIGCAERSMSLTAVLIGCVALAHYPHRWLAAVTGWALCLALTVAFGSRMATIALLLAPALHPNYRRRVSNVAILACLLVAGYGLFYTPAFQQRFFYRGSGTLADVWEGDFLTFGRFESWPAIWEEIWQRPYLGHGVGTTYDFVPTVWHEMHHVHNDYLRIWFELGAVGLLLFLTIMACQIVEVHRRRRSSSGMEQRAWTACQLGLLLFLVTCLTDNTLIYNLWFTDPLFALLGAAYGVGQARQSGEERCAEWQDKDEIHSSQPDGEAS